MIGGTVPGEVTFEASRAGTGYLSEIYSAIQGEGVLTGVRQIFVRLAGCNIRCDYCDQPESLVRTERCRIEKTAGRRDFEERSNPLAVHDVFAAIARLHGEGTLHRWVSFTGGEPLLQADFLAELLPRVREAGLKPFLETSGILPDALANVSHLLDFVSMDWKLPSSSATPPLWARHESFLRGIGHAGGQVKIVVCAGTDPFELERAARTIADVRPGMPLILQPVTPFGTSQQPPAPAQLLDFQVLGLRYLADVRVIPQTHKMIGQL